MAFIGIDPSGDELALSENCGRARLRNAPRELSVWAKNLSPDTVVGVEATGRHHRPVMQALHESGIRSYLLNPMYVHRYIRSLRPHVKTDRWDAILIARYLERELDMLVPYRMPSKEIQELKDLLSYRQTLMEKRVALRQSLGCQDFKLNSGKKLDLAFAEMLREVDRLIKASAQKIPLYARLLQVDGIGPLGSAALTWVLTAFEFEDSDQAVSFMGLDVSVRQSGKYKGRTKLTKRGPAFVRTFLFNGANSLRKLEFFKPLFEHHAAKRLSSTAVNIIVARKLVRIAFALHSNPGAVFESKNLLPQIRTKNET